MCCDIIRGKLLHTTDREKGSVIGAGTLVAKDIPAGSIVVDKRNKTRKER